MLVIAGIILGFLSATVSESFFHKFFAHPSDSQIKFYFKYKILLKAWLKPYFHHLVIHHEMTYQDNLFDQFDSDKNKKDVDNWIERNFDQDFSKLIKDERYNLTLKRASGILPFAGPFCVGPILIGLVLGPVAFFASLTTAYIPVWLSKFIHPLIHNPHETCTHSKFIQWLMKTKYMEAVLLNHFLHHQDGSRNYNLLLGGDYLLGLFRRPTASEAKNFAVLLQDFRSKVRLKELICPPSLQSAPLSTSLIDSELKQADFKKAKSHYLNLGKVGIEERFKFQKLSYKNQTLFEISKSKHENFGMKLFDKNINLTTWTTQKEYELAAYETMDGQVIVRESSFITGDILLTNQNTDSDGLFSTLLDRHIHFAHAALYFLLTINEKSFPAVIEMNEFGIRVVPLKAFLSKHFNTYIEVYRNSHELNTLQKLNLSAAALEILAEEHSFDIYQDRTQNKYVNCARTVELVYKRAGIDFNLGNSLYHQDTFHNLEVLGIEASKNKNLLMPDDFSRSKEFKLIAAISNGDVRELVARNLVRTHLQEIWRNQILAKEQYSLIIKLQNKVISLIQKDNLYSALVLKLLRMKKSSFPSGPADFLSLVPYTDRQMLIAVRHIKDFLDQTWEPRFSQCNWHELINHSQIKSELKLATSGFCRIFFDINAENSKEVRNNIFNILSH
jgi:hypothetical protein